MSSPGGGRRTQAQRREQSRSALLDAAARGIARRGYSRLNLAEVASEAGYTRGALYHQFADKEALALAVVEWVDQTWNAEVGQALAEKGDPAGRLLSLARRHAVFCRRDVAAVLQVLRIEFGDDEPVGRLITERVGAVERRCRNAILTGRRDGSIPPGPPAADTAAALLGAIEAVGIEVGGRAPHDVELTERTARGVLGLTST